MSLIAQLRLELANAAQAATQARPRAERTGQVREAAVALVLRERADHDLDLLLIKRAEYEGDPWSGHMALPGGGWQATDSSLIHTAVRETHEETALLLDPSSTQSLIGGLDVVQPRNPHLPPIRISPWVFAVPHDAEARVASHEVQAVHWVRLGALADPAAHDSVEITFHNANSPPTQRTFPCFRVEGEAVWGLTYRILQDFTARLRPTQR
jgi:8-oxo-dGTP pyrophosphatase MutT (NUDIX family)